MKPVLLIHGYSSESSHRSAQHLYGSLPEDLRATFGEHAILELDLSRWISLSDGISLDDVSFALDRALKHSFPHLLTDGFNAVIHSTGALVIRNWIRLFSTKPSPLQNLVHMAGTHFGSGLAHIGLGQLARWGRLLFGSESGVKVLKELEFGAWKTLDLHLHFLQADCDIQRDYQVYEYCIAGSQLLSQFTMIPIRYVKEDSADGTVRSAASNLNFNYVCMEPASHTYGLSVEKMSLKKSKHRQSFYTMKTSLCSKDRTQVPFAIAYETSHFGDEIGIVSGANNRKVVLPLLKQALKTSPNLDSYGKTRNYFSYQHNKTYARVARLKSFSHAWDKHQQYEGHTQLVFRLRDQHGSPVDAFDVHFRSTPRAGRYTLESMIEDKHCNRHHPGTIVFYLRTQRFRHELRQWDDCFDEVSPVYLDINAYEPDSENIQYLPLSIYFSGSLLRACLQTFRTTLFDVTLLRLPDRQVFKVEPLSKRG